MPLPVRSTSVRNTTTADARLNVPKAAQTAQTRKTQPSRATKLVNEARNVGGEPVEPSVDGSETSSRIPSPFKRDTQADNATKPRAEAVRSTQRPLGHSRQRSTALSTIDGRPKLGHSRSISTVSTTTTATSYTTYTAETSSTSGSDHLKASTSKQKFGSNQRLLGLSTRAKPEIHSRALPPSTFSRTPNASPCGDHLQSELLQLAIVYDASSKGLQRYQSAIERSLVSSRAELRIVQDEITEKQQSFYRALNLEAVNSWLQEYGYQATCQLLQNLSVALRDLSNLEHIFGGDDGLAAIFHTWEQRMITGMATNFSLNEDIRIHLEFHQHLSPDLQRFKQQVRSIQTVFSNLPLNTCESALATVLKLHISLANILHQQSQIMLLTGEALVSNRNEWIDIEIRKAITDSTDSEEQYRLANYLR